MFILTKLNEFSMMDRFGSAFSVFEQKVKLGVWLFYPLADCPPHGTSSMDGPLFGLSTVRITHRNVSSPAWKHHPTDSPPVVKPLVHLGQH